MADKTQYIILVDDETAKTAWRRDASTYAMFVGFMLPGILIGSLAMQALGVVVGITIGCSIAGRIARVTPRMTKAEAVKFLEEQE